MSGSGTSKSSLLHYHTGAIKNSIYSQIKKRNEPKQRQERK